MPKQSGVARHEFGLFIRQHRTKRRISQRALANQLEPTKGESAISRWEIGMALPEVPQLYQLIVLLRMPRAEAYQRYLDALAEPKRTNNAGHRAKRR